MRHSKFAESCNVSFPKNRYHVLEEAQRLMGFDAAEWEHFLNVLKKADGWLTYYRGNVEIQWMRHRGDNELGLNFGIRTGSVETLTVYSFDIRDLQRLTKMRSDQDDNRGGE